MQLPDNISLLFSVPQNPSVATIKDQTDPEFFYDLKLHFREDPNHWKNVWEYRKLNWKEPYNNFQRDCEENYIKDHLKTMEFDLELFLKKNTNVSAEEGAKMFCGKWKGYANTYGVEFVRRAIRRYQLEKMQ